MRKPFELPLGNGLFALVDERDLPLILPHRWDAVKTIRSNTFYAATLMRLSGAMKPQTVFMHRFLLNPEPHQLVDHRDGNGLNNTRRNIRLATHQQNAVNKLPARNSPLGYKGVTEVSAGVFRASITRRGVRQDLGLFETPEEAAQAYNLEAYKQDQCFVRPNPLREHLSLDVNPKGVSETQREAFRLFACEGKALHEIGVILGLNPRAVRSKIRLFIRAIKWELKAEQERDEREARRSSPRSPELPWALDNTDEEWERLLNECR